MIRPFSFLSLLLLLAIPGPAPTATTLDTLPIVSEASATTGPDWLIDPSPYQASLYRNEVGNELIMTNGLIRRVWRLTPNVACVAFDDLTQGKSLLRAVRPEAALSIDGHPLDVGGLMGQPNHAFFFHDWLDTMQRDPKALVLTQVETGTPIERFAWKRVRHHAPDAQWPPKGVALRFDFRLDDQAIEALAEQQMLDSETGRTVLFQDQFTSLGSAWRIHTSPSLERSSFHNEGKPGEIYTLANTAVYAERDLPAHADLVEVQLHPGTDTAGSWGPGLALVWPDRVIKFNYRIGSSADGSHGNFSVWDGQNERLFTLPQGPISPANPLWLRMRLEDNALFGEISHDGIQWLSGFELNENLPQGSPQALRVGKLSRSGQEDDFATNPQDPIRLRIMKVAAYGPLQRDAVASHFKQLLQLKDVTVSVHYEMYDGIPTMSKWITVHNPLDRPLTVDRFTSEILAVVENGNPVETRAGVSLPKPDSLHVETDMAFGGFEHMNACRGSIHWVPDPFFETQVNYERMQPCLLEVRPEIGPDQDIHPGGTFESFRTFEVVYDSTERSRRGLTLRKMYRTVAPWVTENPLMMHMRDSSPQKVKEAIDQCAETGFEMLILSFGSGFNMETTDPAYLQQYRELAAYAQAKSIEIGGYSLLSSRRISPDSDNIKHPLTGEPGGQTHGYCPALTSPWGQDYFDKLYKFFPSTSFNLLEHDGSYPGDIDAIARPPLQKSMENSQWAQWRIITDFYKWCRGEGVYLNVPDYYYLAGSNKCGMGYRETNWSLPRAQQVIHSRQNIFDGTSEKTPSMGWMFVPLSQYHGGGEAATVEPLDTHLDHYQMMMLCNLSAGVQACYRGPRLYDTERTKQMVQTQVAWFKKYRGILESDIIHDTSRRATGRDLDWYFHANPSLEEKGFLAIFNPLDHAVTKTIPLNLYYTGLTTTAHIAHKDQNPEKFTLNRDYTVQLPVTIPAHGMTWYVVR
ncbi:MAG: hypothetical protein RBU29_12420 [bacterium]|jgi:hypothetical protein|nr:hypothetical protein [bacterium]